jgi:hypothetical protein
MLSSTLGWKPSFTSLVPDRAPVDVVAPRQNSEASARECGADKT